MLGLSDLFGRFARSPVLAQALELSPPQAGGLLATAQYGTETVQAAPALINVGAAFALWRQAPDRRVWRVRPDTAAYLRGVGLSFLPELPPASWSGAAIVIESTDQSPLVRDYFSIGAYQCEDREGMARYFVVGLRTPDGVFAYGVRSNLAVLNDRLAKTGALLDLDMLGDDLVTTPASRERQEEALELLKFVLATSYYALDPRPDLVSISHSPGLPDRDVHGKVRRAGGRPVPLWTYADLTVTPPIPVEDEGHGALDKSGLSLAPVVVRPYVRRLETGKIIIVDAHDSHRWRRPDERIGTKTRI